MGYPDNVLAADEHVVLHRHPHWKRLIGPVLALLVGTALAAFVAAVVNHTNWDSNAKNIIFAVIGSPMATLTTRMVPSPVSKAPTAS